MSPADDHHEIHCRLDEILDRQGMTLTQLAEQVGITVVNLSVLDNDRAKSVRFSTLTAICRAVECTPGDLLALADEP